MSDISFSSVQLAFPSISFDANRFSSGGQKSVFFGADSSGKSIALKIVNVPLAGEDEDSFSIPGHIHERIIREVTSLRDIQSPYLATIVDGPESRTIGHKEYLWYTEPQYEDSLDLVIGSNGSLRTERLVELVHCLLLAERDLHQNGLVHRDIKPQNVVVDPVSRNYILIDLGVALHWDLPRLTEMTPTLTPVFAAPEQFELSPLVDHRTDLFQIGLTAYIAATGVHPFYDRYVASREDYLRRIADGPDVNPLHEYAVPDDLARFITKCLGARPNRRYRTLEQALKAFRDATGKDGES